MITCEYTSLFKIIREINIGLGLKALSKKVYLSTGMGPVFLLKMASQIQKNICSLKNNLYNNKKYRELSCFVFLFKFCNFQSIFMVSGTYVNKDC